MSYVDDNNNNKQLQLHATSLRKVYEAFKPDFQINLAQVRIPIYI